MSTARQSLGRRGEVLAAGHLTRMGYTLLEQNWRCPSGEIDLVMQHLEELVFVEVRTRRAPNTNSAIESISKGKQARMIAAAEAYLEANQLNDTAWRIDLAVVAITPSGIKIEVIENAIGW